MSKFLDIRPDRVSVVPLGINMKGYERRASRGDEYRVGYFARVAPEKGLRELAEAYVRFRRKVSAARVSLHAAGYMAPGHRAYLDEARHVLEREGLGGEFSYHGALDRDGKLRFLRSLDVLSVPATYDEPKGMFLLEAMASGVPVLQPKRGAFTEVIEKTGGGLLVAPGDGDALADGLHRLWNDNALSSNLSQRAFDGVRSHYTISASATRQLEVYDMVARRASTGLPC
jgi:glycosyltransferase involved in cell wall biosynthesis